MGEIIFSIIVLIGLLYIFDAFFFKPVREEQKIKERFRKKIAAMDKAEDKRIKEEREQYICGASEKIVAVETGKLDELEEVAAAKLKELKELKEGNLILNKGEVCYLCDTVESIELNNDAKFAWGYLYITSNRVILTTNGHSFDKKLEDITSMKTSTYYVRSLRYEYEDSKETSWVNTYHEALRLQFGSDTISISSYYPELPKKLLEHLITNKLNERKQTECVYCGANNTAKANKCENCGAPLK